MGKQLAIDVPIENKTYEKALAQYNKMEKPPGHRIFLCYCKSKKEYFVNWLFSREFLTKCGIEIKM